MPTIDTERAPEAARAWLERVRPRIDAELERQLTPRAAPADPPAARLAEAVRYAALGPGKRLRPAIALAAAEAVGGELEQALPAAAAVELLHAYTLVHDDLPVMDDDAERRGRPTAHVAFGEQVALLAGDALLTAAFGALAELGPRAADAVAVLAARAGAGELLAGQARDLAHADHRERLSLDDVELIHIGKTGALFSAAAEIGGIAGGASADARVKLARYGLVLGVAFQHADDRDDREFTHQAGPAARRMEALAEEAASLASSFGEPGAPLLAVARWIARPQ